MKYIEIHIKGRISHQWSGWFEGLTVNYSCNDETIITGAVADQAAMYGIISHLRDLGLTLISVSSKEHEEDSHEYNQ